MPVPADATGVQSADLGAGRASVYSTRSDPASLMSLEEAPTKTRTRPRGVTQRSAPELQ